MNNIFAAATKAALLVFFSLACAAAFAQQDDDLIIIEDSSKTSKSGDAKPASSSDISFSGELIGSYSGLIDNNERYQTSLKLRYFQQFNDNFSVVVEGRGYTSGVKLELTRRERAPDAVKETFTRKITANKLELNEGYFRFNKGIVDIYLGRRKIVLGQFDVFSPVDFVLPIDLSNSEVSFTKLERKYPQTVASLYLYPIPKLELQFHYFPYLERDPITKRLLETPVDYFADGEEVQAPFRRPKNTDQYLARAVYTGEKFTAGVTYYSGFALYPEERERLVMEQGELSVLPEPSYPSFTGYGFEISIPIKRILLKYEALIGQMHQRFFPCAMRDTTECNNYVNILMNSFGGRLYTNSNAMIHAIGFDYLSEKWTINFALFNIVDLATSTEKSTKQLSESLSGSDTGQTGAVAPSFNVARKWGRNKSHTTGIAGGFFGTTLGASAYHVYKLNDNLSALLALEILSYTSNEQFEEQVESDENAAANADPNANGVSVSTTSFVSPAVRVGFTYRF